MSRDASPTPHPLVLASTSRASDAMPSRPVVPDARLDGL